MHCGRPFLHSVREVVMLQSFSQRFGALAVIEEWHVAGPASRTAIWVNEHALGLCAALFNEVHLLGLLLPARLLLLAIVGGLMTVNRCWKVLLLHVRLILT